ncbi:MAG: hypothetical protein DMG97_38575 [Acidobacteria bacterium]|nr:MAG: hypothetical protein DMG97_38575 [Acidobacteriota bacterium]
MIPLNALGIGGGELTGIAKEFTTHTNRNAATNGHTRGAGSQSIGEDTRDTPLRVERVPLIAAGARPAVVLTGRPAAWRASDAGAGGVEALVFRFAIHNDR